ncbi:hypothetical protein CUZ93_1697 [Enterococcus xinjiangensis]|nr:hypothetical protein [Enterococcus lactis]
MAFIVESKKQFHLSFPNVSENKQKKKWKEATSRYHEQTLILRLKVFYLHEKDSEKKHVFTLIRYILS